MNRTFAQYKTDIRPSLRAMRRRETAYWVKETYVDILIEYAEFRRDIRRNPLLSAATALLGMFVIGMFIASVLGD